MAKQADLRVTVKIREETLLKFEAAVERVRELTHEVEQALLDARRAAMDLESALIIGPTEDEEED